MVLMQVEPAMMLIVLLMKLAIVPMEPVVQVVAPPMMKAAYAVGSLVARTEEEQLVIIAPYLCLFLVPFLPNSYIFFSTTCRSASSSSRLPVLYKSQRRMTFSSRYEHDPILRSSPLDLPCHFTCLVKKC